MGKLQGQTFPVVPDLRKQGPPGLARQLFEWWCRRAEIEDLLGDIDEYFQYNVEHKGLTLARLIYFQQVLSLSFSYAIRKRKRSASYSSYYAQNSLAMLNNYFKIAIRNFSKHKLFTSLNILGLALGMSICLLALSVSVSIYRSDEFHSKKDRIYQINTYIKDHEKTKTYTSTYPAIGHQLLAKYPFVEEVVQIKAGFTPYIRHKGEILTFSGYFTGSSFFQLFDFSLTQGNPNSVLAEPFSVVLTESMAETLFKDQDPIGKLLETESGTFQVTGVMKDPHQTHFYFEVLTSYQTYSAIQSLPDLRRNWVNYQDHYTYALLKPDASQASLTSALHQMSKKAEAFNTNTNIELQSVSLDKVVPRWNVSNALGIGWDQPSLLFFLSIGLLILLPAVFNYINLSIARALKRAKEIGIRKVVGAEKRQIKAQFIVETIILTFMALLGSIFIHMPLREEFLELVASARVMDTSWTLELGLAFIIFTLIIGILAGLFPALYFSRLNPIHTLKGEIKNRTSAVSGIKKGLFVLQFLVSLVFMIGVAAISKQYRHVFNYNHGFESNNLLTIPFGNIDKQLVINELRLHPDVKAITTSSSLPGLFLSEQQEITSNGLDTIATSEVFIGENFVENLGIKVVWGDQDVARNSTHNEELVLVNEEFMRTMAVFDEQEDSVRFTMADGTHCRIVGILEDFHFEPLSELIRPLVLRHSLAKANYALLTIHSTNIRRTLEEFEQVWRSIDQTAHFETAFLEEEMEAAYYFLEVQIKFFSYLSAFAITIACLGLLGMVSYTTENRTKEIAIRKIMGASTQSLYYLLTKDFIRLILIAALIAIPFSYVFYDMLFLHFLIRYGSGLGVLDVILSIAFLFLIGFLSIYWQTSMVARANPAGNLRYE